jgi:hypothetical protein
MSFIIFGKRTPTAFQFFPSLLRADLVESKELFLSLSMEYIILAEEATSYISSPDLQNQSNLP